MDFNKELFDEFVKEFVDNDAGVIRNQYPDGIFNWFRNKQNLGGQVQLEQRVSQQLASVITHLRDSFEKAQKLLDDKEIGMQLACTELFIANSEAREMLSKLSG
jgi:hypothetical protein